MFRYNLFFTYDCTNFCNANGMPGMPELECCYNNNILCAYMMEEMMIIHSIIVFFVFLVSTLLVVQIRLPE